MLRQRIKHALLRRSNFSNKAFEVHWVDDYRGLVQRTGLYVKSWMMQVHHIKISIPLVKPFTIPFCMSDLAGNGAFIFLAISYLETDFLQLRAYALSGIAMSIVFQYYREKPLWIPIRWNTVFLLINAAMLMALLKDKHDAENIPEEQKFLYQTVFENKGMKPVDFLHLINAAERAEHKKGTKLVQQDSKNKKVHLVIKGKLLVTRGNEKVGTININQFVGAMSFLTWSSKVDLERAAEEQEQEQRRHEMALHPEEVALENEDGIVLKMDHSAEIKQRVADDKNSTANAGHSGWANVIVDEDVTVFSWSFRDLKKLIEENPIMGVSLERTISEDLNKKMANNWLDEPKNRYKQLLTGALMDGEITPEKRELIKKGQKELGINDEEHLEVLKGLSWTKEQYEAGYRGTIPGDALQKYQKMLKRCVDSEEITEDDRRTLRKFRLLNGISPVRHQALLRQFGWSLDQFEAGTKKPEKLEEEPLKLEPIPPPFTGDRFYYLKKAYNYVTTGSTSSPKPKAEPTSPATHASAETPPPPPPQSSPRSPSLREVVKKVMSQEKAKPPTTSN